ncbi:glycerol kinase [Bradyrhizobium centrolobii]|uniref:ATP:glycerol 3-phosphotransferase n=1 Tax=Bradyrhizobium centrolobii TaxID=1505087 RepID=A0A176Z025_9BRAD|nr:FGGY family carbohydrate kinase [Bradyrhizobium centrolobii]OAF13051.1 glycerol kinase [Bradyrhizobium centrolobii]
MTSGVLAIDQGTTNTKALLIDASGIIVARASVPVAVTHPQPGWAEQSGEAIWQSVQAAVDECLRVRSDVKLASIGISNQRESVLLWDRATGDALGPCVTWQCRRSTERLAPLRRPEVETLVAGKTGLGLDPLFPAAKIGWLLDNVAGARAAAKAGTVCAGTVDSWLLSKLTGGKVHATDFSNASRTQLFDIHRLCWDDELARLFDAQIALLPQALPSDSVFGVTVAQGAIPQGLTVGAMMGDSHAALYGHGIRAPGAVKATYGTGSSLMTLTERPVLSRNGLSSTIAWGVGGNVAYALEGNISVSGQAAAFATSLLGLPDEAALARLAQSVESSDGVFFVPALAGLGAPHWRADVRGLFTGMSLSTRPAHFARATLEAIALQIYDVFVAMQADRGMQLSALSADGGASRNDLLMQIQSDVLQKPVRRSRVAELSAIGAGIMAGIRAGLWSEEHALSGLITEADVFAPTAGESSRDRLVAGWRSAIDQAIAGTRR